MIKVSDFIAKFLAEHKDTGKTVFMVSGGGNMHLIDSLSRENRLEYICNHHEQACTFASEGYARVSNKIGLAYVYPKKLIMKTILNNIDDDDEVISRLFGSAGKIPHYIRDFYWLVYFYLLWFSFSY